MAVPLILFKVWGLALLLVFSPTSDALLFIAATHWMWVVLPALLLGGPAYAWYRLVRVRRRRKQLLRAEWMGSGPGSGPGGPTVDLRPQWPLWETVSRVEGGGS